MRWLVLGQPVKSAPGRACVQAHAQHTTCSISRVRCVGAGGVLYDGRGTYNDVISYAERLFSRIRQTVSGWVGGWTRIWASGCAALRGVGGAAS